MTSPNPDRLDELTDRRRLKTTICIPDRDEYMLESPNDLPGTNITLHEMFIIVGGVCMGLSIIITFLNLCSHLKWRSNLAEQKQAMRIMILPIVFTVFAWASIVVYGLGNYLEPIPKLYEIYVIACFHHLMVHVICPDEEKKKDFFIQADRMNRTAKRTIHAQGSYRWYRVQAMFVHLSPFIIAILTIVEEILVYNECKSDSQNEAGTTVLSIITIIFVIMAVMSLLRFYIRFKPNYQGTKTLRKFWAVKGIVFLYMTQSLVLTIIKATGAAKPTEYMTKSDFEYGLFEFLLCVEGFFLSIFCVWALSALEYRTKRLNANGTGSAPDASVLRYLWTFLFPKEIFIGFVFALQTLFQLCLGSRRYDYTAGTGVGWKERRQGSGPYVPLTNVEGHKEDQSDDAGYHGA